VSSSLGGIEKKVPGTEHQLHDVCFKTWRSFQRHNELQLLILSCDRRTSNKKILLHKSIRWTEMTYSPRSVWTQTREWRLPPGGHHDASPPPQGEVTRKGRDASSSPRGVAGRGSIRRDEPDGLNDIKSFLKELETASFTRRRHSPIRNRNMAFNYTRWIRYNRFLSGDINGPRVSRSAAAAA